MHLQLRFLLFVIVQGGLLVSACIFVIYFKAFGITFIIQSSHEKSYPMVRPVRVFPQKRFESHSLYTAPLFYKFTFWTVVVAADNELRMSIEMYVTWLG